MRNMKPLKTGLIVSLLFSALPQVSAGAEPTRITVTIDRGRDLGQSFGSLFEAASDNASLVLGAGFQNGYNTRYRADRHSVQLFVRPASGNREMKTEELPRSNNELTGSYLFGVWRAENVGFKITGLARFRQLARDHAGR